MQPSTEKIQTEQVTTLQTVEPTYTPVPTDTPALTKTPLPTPEPRNELTLNSLGTIYNYEVEYNDANGDIQSYNVYNELSEIEKQQLLELYNDFGLTLVFDSNKYNSGKYEGSNNIENVSPDMIPSYYFVEISELSYSIAVTYVFFNYLVEIGGEVMRQWIDISVSYVYLACDFATSSESTLENGGEVVLELESAYYTENYIFPRILGEVTTLFVDSGSLHREDFTSYNSFGTDYGGNWMDEYLNLKSEKVFNSDSDRIHYFHNESGLITRDGFESLDNDWAEYQLGLWFGYDVFWLRYYDCETIRLKTDAQLEQYQKINPNYTLEFFYELSCSWADDYPVDDISEDVQDISYVYEYIENNYDN